MRKPPPFLEPSGAELDCGYNLSEREWIRGFLRLPDSTDAGRCRFVEDIPELVASEDELGPLPLFLLDGHTGTPACLLDYFVSRHQLRTPTPPAFPLELLVNTVIIGSDDAEQLYKRATLRCDGLLHFLDVATLTPEDVARAGSSRQHRAVARQVESSLTLVEGAQMEVAETSASIRWHGEIQGDGEPRTLQAWSDSLASDLLLFAFLLDRPLRPERVYAQEGRKQIYLYASWSEPSAPNRIVPLVRLSDIEGRFGDLVDRWRALLRHAQDLLDHLGEYQLNRHRLTLPDQVLLLFRCIELYHDSCDRFRSVVRPKSEHRDLVKQILASLPSDLQREHAQWIQTSLREANRKRLVDQVREVIDDLGPRIQDSCKIDDTTSFASVAKSTRNHYTHPTGKPPSEVPEGRALLVLIHRLWFVARACLLIELGFSRDDVATALRRSSQRTYLLH